MGASKSTASRSANMTSVRSSDSEVSAGGFSSVIAASASPKYISDAGSACDVAIPVRLERNARFDCIEGRSDAGSFVGSLQKAGFGQRLNVVMDASIVPIEVLGERANR